MKGRTACYLWTPALCILNETVTAQFKWHSTALIRRCLHLHQMIKCRAQEVKFNQSKKKNFKIIFFEVWFIDIIPWCSSARLVGDCSHPPLFLVLGAFTDADVNTLKAESRSTVAWFHYFIHGLQSKTMEKVTAKSPSTYLQSVLRRASLSFTQACWLTCSPGHNVSLGSVSVRWLSRSRFCSEYMEISGVLSCLRDLCDSHIITVKLQSQGGAGGKGLGNGGINFPPFTCLTAFHCSVTY